jgi:uncharacterized protein YbbC (DUF1343 family)/CubicO group peptidase (beta-lactamase class C family)
MPLTLLALVAAVVAALIPAAPASFTPAVVHGQSRSLPPPSDAPLPAVNLNHLARIDELVEQAIAGRLLPGAVVLVGRGDETVYEKAFGRRAVVPAGEPMTVDTIFDIASLTKVVGTTTAVMTLVEQGRIRLNDPVSAHIPGFERHGKTGITIRHLLTHVSGLRPDVDLHPWNGYAAAIELAIDEVPTAAPGAAFVYSDINFFLLGDIVSRVAGRPLDAYLQRALFEPLGMRDTGFLPAAALRPRIAPTERCAEQDAWPCKRPGAAPLRGVVHDPTARRMGGVAGHAGLFSTARDLQRFVRMLIRGGELDGARVMSAAAVARMIAPSQPRNLTNLRGLGWDIDSSFSSNRGDLFPIGSYGHTGFTGTSLWIDPASRAYVIFLSSRLHPDGVGDVTALRSRIATVAAAALSGGATSILSTAVVPAAAPAAADPRPPAPVLSGIDVLARDGFALLRGKKVGLVTNHTGRANDGRTTIDLLHAAPGVQLVSLFSPEHGIRGIVDEDVPSSRDEKTGLPVHSLYGATRRPTEAMLQGVDAIVIDLMDVGSRFYTYPATIGYVMEEAAKRQIAVVVLDRVNPINGWQIEGPYPDDEVIGFNAYLPMPVRHGATLGELARLFNEEKQIGADLTVVAAERWRRDDWFDDTGLLWVNPSPNMRNLNQATLYPGIGAIEYSNISVGRGTDQPFEQIGAPWVDGPRLAAALNARTLPGIRFYPVAFTPASSKYAGQECEGVFMVITDRVALRPVRVGLEVAGALARLHGDRYQLENTARLLGSRDSLARVTSGEDPAAVAASWSADEARWRRLRAKYLLYR